MAELKLALTLCGKENTEEEVETIFKKIDADKSQYIEVWKHTRFASRFFIDNSLYLKL
jgi:Ca2+-binding EF-hand superfamily protein